MAPKNVLAWMPESKCFRTLCGSETVRGKQTLLKSVWQKVYANFPLIQHRFIQKTSLFVRCEVLGLFGNALAANHMYCRDNWEKFPQHVKTPLSQKAKRFYPIFIAFLESTKNFACFEEKFQLYSLNSWEVIGSQRCGCFECPKAPVSEDSSAVKVLTGARHCGNLFGRSLIPIFH